MAGRTSGGRSVGIVRSRTQTMEFVFFLFVQGEQYTRCGREVTQSVIKVMNERLKIGPQYSTQRYA
jgi:hypothetical protein